jgi:hypothetical protein
LLAVARKYVAELPASHIKHWFAKAGFQTGDEEKEILEDPNTDNTDRCSIPKDVTFDKLESIVCVDESGTVQRENGLDINAGRSIEKMTNLKASYRISLS